MRLVILGVGLLVLAVHPRALSDDGNTVNCDADCTIIVTVDEQNGSCKPKVPTQINVSHPEGVPRIVITWKLDKPDIQNGFRFYKGMESEKRGIRLLDGDPPTYTHVGVSGEHLAPHRRYRWRVAKPSSAEDRLPRAYEVNVIRRSTGDPCAAADPVIVNMN